MLNIPARAIFVSHPGNRVSVVGILDALLVSRAHSMPVFKGVVRLDAT